jgi:aspartate/methionine/tyrosine aminotransferase
MSVFASRIAAMGTENAFRISEDVARAQARGVEVIRFTIGEPDFDSAPHINQAGIESILKGNTHYTDPAGVRALRDAVAAHVKKTRGIDVDPDEVIVLPGAKPAIGYSLMCYVNPGDEVIYPSPGFPIYESWVTYLGGTPVPLVLREENGFAFTPKELEKLVTPRTKVVMLCTPSNPTGGVLSQELLEAVAEIVRRKAHPDCRVYSDEIYEHITFDGFRHFSIASVPGMRERTLIASGHSKGFAMTGWRLGWCVLPNKQEAAVFKQLNINLVSCVPPFVQEAGREAFQSPKTAEVVAHMVAEFKRRRDYLVPALNQIEGIRCATPLGAFYVFPNVDGVCRHLGIHDYYGRLSDDRKKKTSPATLLMRFLLYYHGIATVDRRSFGVLRSDGQHFVRISYATDMKSIEEGVARIGKGAGDVDGFRKFTDDAEALGV